MRDRMSFYWDEFLDEGDELHKYMTDNFISMFDGDTKIKHFYIKNEFLQDIGAEKVNEEHGEEIQKELIVWIKNELEEETIFEKENWKPFRDRYTLTDMYLGFKKMFVFKDHYFQLILENYCQTNTCTYCKSEEDQENSTFFALSYYGWTDDKIITLQPYNDVVVMQDNILPYLYWSRK
jgi:hypothetical protein